MKVHSKRVKMRPLRFVLNDGVIYFSILKIYKYTRNEWGRCENTLETSGEDVKIHSKRVKKLEFYFLRGFFWSLALTVLGGN